MPWRGGRVVECARLEIECCESNREFESPPLRSGTILTKNLVKTPWRGCALRSKSLILLELRSRFRVIYPADLGYFCSPQA